ncbi:hypothetical protein A3K73_04925 [Candidatus Pacearchaeota archaeon RBG_13_36_9]|nr:MAG: hypothetical protein A3K73_04925 [Candidatus Pacearchaeota archaeon RBG_13_36_9]
MDALERRTEEVILVLGAGIVGWMNEQRVRRALEYEKNVPIILSGGKGGFLGSYMKQTEAQTMKRYLSRYGAGERVLLEQESRNTEQNFRSSKELIDSLAPKRVIIVTSSCHMSRALAYTKRILKDYEIVPFPTKPKWHDWRGQLCELGCYVYEHTKIPLENAIGKIRTSHP